MQIAASIFQGQGRTTMTEPQKEDNTTSDVVLSSFCGSVIVVRPCPWIGRRQSSWLHKLRSVFWLLMGQQRLIRQLTAAYRFTSTVAAADVLGLCW